MNRAFAWKNILRIKPGSRVFGQSILEERMEKMGKRTGKRFICLLVAIMILLTAGCGKQDGTGSPKGEGRGKGSDGQQAAVGMYVETETDLPVQMDDIAGIYKIPEGKLVVIDRQGELLVSEDNGVTWESSSRQWMKERAASSYIMDIKMDSKGVLGIIYAENGEEGLDMQESATPSVLKCVLLLPDETVIPVRFSKPEDARCIDRFWISDTDRYFVSTVEGDIYEVKEDGSSEWYLSTQGSPQIIQFQGNLMMIDGYDFKGPLLYDMEKEEYVEDGILTDFVHENYENRGFNGNGWHSLYLIPGEEDVVYLAGKEGMYRHVIGGTVMEQMIDGRLSRLGNPQYGIVGMVFLETGDFLAVSKDGKLIRFTYDPDKEAVFQEVLKVYSLEKNSDIYAAVSFYQIQNPNVFVEYEVGLEEGGAVTKEDAIKKLNTQIMAGEGPDILVLDGLPLDSYMKKGILCELDGFVEDLGQEKAFENLLRAFQTGGNIYAIPGQVKFPVMLGREKDIAKMTGLSSVADGIEQMRLDAPGKDLIGLCSEKAVMRLFAIISSQEWKKNDEIDRNAVAEFLIRTKRIYEAQMNGMEGESLERLRQSNEYYVQSEGENWMYDLMHYGYFMDYVAGYSNAFIGISGSPDSYMELTSISKANGLEDTVLVPMEGEEGRVFIPEMVLGISAATAKKELAEDFLEMFFGKENQCRLSGYAVNREAFIEAFSPKVEEVGENGEYRKFGVIDEGGREIWLDIFIPADEEIAAVTEWMETAKIPYMEDTVFEECIFEEGSLFILGGRGIEETLDIIEKRLAIYIAE